MKPSGKFLVLLSFLALCLVIPLPVFAAAENHNTPAQPKRLAIVIGNSNYQSDRYEDLPNAANDATKLSESLRRLNFEVVVGTDETSDQFEKIFERFEGKLDSYTAVLIFYAGHGVQVDGQNFLLPVDSLDPANVGNLTAKAVKLNDVIARFASRDRPTFIFLDACRNTPLGLDSAGVGRGLAQVEVGENTFIAFATQPGNVTVDGAGQNSPFTKALLENIEFPGLSISDMMIRVRNATEASTLGSQVPWDQSNLREQFYFTELQVIDPQELGATLNRILQIPSAKAKLMTQLASADSDLQSTVLLLGRQLPEIVRSADPASQNDAGQQQMASLAPADLEKDVASALGSVVSGADQNGSDVANQHGSDVSRRVQAELSRLGCYRKPIDGVWGQGSQKALSDYYRQTKQANAVPEPNLDLLGDLFLRSGRVCRQPVAAPKPVKTATMDRARDGTKASRSSGRAPQREKVQRQQKARPAAPPPDIGAGIGIGGIF
ncbi:caspase family protein [Mesorhizobium sp. CGMCC 1.15528]|uniref:Caspase family protein n=1 Tax=Mesorhizobium zhangyense TaxID=1776730 RepID=A0A7C9R9E7_9HYPH|nr:caspase family protein [Mesorhizobium zhangyense]